MRLEGLAARIFTGIVDRVRFFVAVYLAVRWAVSEDGAALPWRAALLAPAIIASHTLMEIVYAMALGDGALSPLKRGRVFKDAQSLELMMGLLFMTVQLAVLTGLGSYFGMFCPVIVAPAGTLRDWLSGLTVPYLEFWAINILKDALSMHIFHRAMHDKRWPYLSGIHERHHRPKTNLNSINGSQIHPLDLFLENSIGPFLLVVVYACFGKAPQICNISFLMLISSEGSCHSCNPYTVCYYLPPFDMLLHGNVAHNLHHAAPSRNLYLVPWHHLLGEKRDDLDSYNRIMKTAVRF